PFFILVSCSILGRIPQGGSTLGAMHSGTPQLPMFNMNMVAMANAQATAAAMAYAPTAQLAFHGQGSGEGGGKRKRKQACWYYEHACCEKGSACPFSHEGMPGSKGVVDLPASETCWFFEKGACTKGLR
ncbi:unnamed protein product, partial [Polarella glacialis]